MNQVNVRISKLNLTASTPDERHSWLAAKVTPECSEIVVKVEPDHHSSLRETRAMRFQTSAQVAALMAALNVMRLRMEEAERAAVMGANGGVEYVVNGDEPELAPYTIRRA